MAKLVVLTEGFAGQSCDVKAEPTSIGRVEDNAFQIPEGSVSSHHCEVFLRGSEVVIRDLNSTNGTFIESAQITGEGVLKPGQSLRLGQVELRLEGGKFSSATSAPAAAAARSAEAADAPRKQKLTNTRAIPQGVKLGELDQATRPIAFVGPFEKKSNKGTKMVIVAAIVLGVIIAGILIFSVLFS